MPDEVPPIEPGKMLKGGWNRDPPGPRPRMVPQPYGIPFAPDRAEQVARDRLALAERDECAAPAPVEPIEPGTMMKGGWNRDPPGPRPRMVPKPYGIPFDPHRAENVRRDALAAESEPDYAEFHEPVPPIEPATMLKGGWNRDVPWPRPRMVPQPAGVPFDRDSAERIRRDRLARLAPACGMADASADQRVQLGPTTTGGEHRHGRGTKSKLGRFFSWFFLRATLRRERT